LEVVENVITKKNGESRKQLVGTCAFRVARWHLLKPKHFNLEGLAMEDVGMYVYLMSIWSILLGIHT
jgi:hypothetical protein